MEPFERQLIEHGELKQILRLSLDHPENPDLIGLLGPPGSTVLIIDSREWCDQVIAALQDLRDKCWPV
jgi:hypothetical protein